MQQGRKLRPLPSGNVENQRSAPRCDLIETVAQSLIENGDAAIDLVSRDGERRRDAPDRSALRPAPDVHGQAQLVTALRGDGAKLVPGLALLAILHQLHAEK